MSTAITVSERAARRIGQILKGEGDGAMLRISVEGGGCSGFQYKFDVEHNKAEDDLVLMDVQMPVMDGHAATRAIRSGGFTSLPIVALTANAFPEDARLCREAGMSDFLAKPLRKQTLVDAILRALDLAEQAPTLVPELPHEAAAGSQARFAAAADVQSAN